MMNANGQKFWDEFIIANGGNFLQSWDWAEIQKNIGRKIWRLKNNKAVTLIVKMPLPLGKNYLYSPRGPIFKDKHSLNEILNEIKKIAREQKSLFYRFEPINQISNNEYQVTTPIQPPQTMILDLTPSTENLLKSFHQKTRYNIKLAQRKKVTIREGKTNQDFEIFWNILNKTYSKKDISTHPKKYYQTIFNTPVNKSSFQVKLYIAEKNNQPLAANLCYFYGNTATYTHGGSDYKYRKLMAPHLLQWHQITQAKRLGCTYYDFWGYDEKKWPGVSRFKSGFNGQKIKYPGTFDLPLNKPWYLLYNLIRKFR